MAGWSPVIMATWIPARRQAAIAARRSGRGGSSKPRMADELEFALDLGGRIRRRPHPSPVRAAATAQRAPSGAAYRSTAASASVGAVGAQGQDRVRRPLDRQPVGRGRSTCVGGAGRREAAGPRCGVVRDCRSDGPTTSIAASIGSPIADHRPSSHRSTRPSEQRRATAATV